MKVWFYPLARCLINLSKFSCMTKDLVTHKALPFGTLAHQLVQIVQYEKNCSNPKLPTFCVLTPLSRRLLMKPYQT